MGDTDDLWDEAREVASEICTGDCSDCGNYYCADNAANNDEEDEDW